MSIKERDATTFVVSAGRQIPPNPSARRLDPKSAVIDAPLIFLPKDDLRDGGGDFTSEALVMR